MLKNYGPKPVGPPGYFTTISQNKASLLRETMARYYLIYPPNPRITKPVFNLPTVDPVHG